MHSTTMVVVPWVGERQGMFAVEAGWPLWVPGARQEALWQSLLLVTLRQSCNRLSKDEPVRAPSLVYLLAVVAVAVGLVEEMQVCHCRQK